NQLAAHYLSAPAVAIAANGTALVVWQDGIPGIVSPTAVYGRLLNAAGAPVGSEFLVNVVGGNQGAPDVAALPGGFVVTWESTAVDGNGFGVVSRRYDLNGTALTGEVRVNTFITNAQRA